MSRLLACITTFLLTAVFGVSAQACDRTCLTGHLTEYLYAMFAHDASTLKVAPDVKFTENSVKAKLGDGLWKTATRFHGYRQDFIDERAGVAGTHVIIEESGAPTLLVLRLKVANELIAEIETVTTHSRTEGVIFNLDGLKAPSRGMQYVPAPNQLMSREEAIRIASLYPAGLKAGSFVTVDVPYTPQAYRIENGNNMLAPAALLRPVARTSKPRTSRLAAPR